MKRLVAGCIAVLFSVFTLSVTAVELHMYAGAGLREPTETILKRFEEKTGHRVVVEYGGMGQLLTRYQATHSGDLFLSGGRSYVQQLAQAEQIVSQVPLIKHTAVMAISKKKGVTIQDFAELARSDLRLGMGDPKAIALGVSGEEILEKSGHGEALRAKIVVRATTIKQLLLYLLNGEVDAAVIGRSDAIQNADKLIVLPTPSGVSEEVTTLAVLKSSQHPEVAQTLADFFAQPDNIDVFIQRGYLPLDPNTK